VLVNNESNVGKVRMGSRNLRNGGRPKSKMVKRNAKRNRVVTVALGNWNGIGSNKGYVAGPLQAIKRRLQNSAVYILWKLMNTVHPSVFFPLVD
jgi:hypothetical protein